jgi:hypothetical protein
LPVGEAFKAGNLAVDRKEAPTWKSTR